MTEWYLAPSLVALRTEINRRWPARDKASDGALGDPSHQARKSDHNPDWDAPGARAGVVRAIDVTARGIDVTELLDAVVRDPRVAYVIWNRRIASATDDGMPWDWEPYAGTNPHDKHIHVSIKHTLTAEAMTTRWFKEQEFELTATQYETLLNEIRACRRDVRDYALWEVLYELETEDERAAAEEAYDKARAAGASITDAKAAAARALQGLVTTIKTAKTQ